MVRAAIAVASGGTASLSMPSAACSAGVTLSWNTGPPWAASSSHARPGSSGWNAVAGAQVAQRERRAASSPPPGRDRHAGRDLEPDDAQRHANPRGDLEGAGPHVHDAHGAPDTVVRGLLGDRGEERGGDATKKE